jgi:UrcA family protein
MMTKLLWPLVLAGTLALGASAAFAQDYGTAYDSYTPPPYGGPPGPGEEVTVTAPHYPRERSTIGAPIENVSLQRAVRFDDLDLRTGWGAHVLRVRVARTARTLCRQLEFRYPVGAPDQSGCYRRAYGEAMADVHEAVASARYGSRPYADDYGYEEP